MFCGDATSATDVSRVLAGAKPTCILTDPPCCSGGFQESGKSSGSVGTTARPKQIANDRLSTRGCQALICVALKRFQCARCLYVFTDWRMWVNLFDIVEASGFGVRSMICWDKGSPGMGRGWRAQHELIMWACKETPPFDKHASGQGNVIAAARTGNEYHTTEKPVALLTTLLTNTPLTTVIADPFLRSGSKLITAEQLDRTVYGLDLDPLYYQVAIDRWEAFTGQQAVKVVGP